MYFWEDNLERAYQWAVEMSQRKNSKIQTPCVLGAVIDLNHCFDLVQTRYLEEMRLSFLQYAEQIKKKNLKLPENTLGEDKILRRLDCAVIEYMHDMREAMGMEPYDTIRGVFWEGSDLYPGAGFKERNHIQICIRNPHSIKGFFIPDIIE